MVGKYMSKEEKTRALALKEKVPIKEICFRIKRSKATIMRLLSQAKGHPAGYIPCPKQIKERPRKTSRKSDKLLKREVEKDPMISSTQGESIQIYLKMYH